MRISEVNYFTFNVDNEFLSLCHFNKSTDKDWFFSFQQSNVRNGRIKLNLLNETLSDSLTVYTLFFLLIHSSGMEQFMKKNIFFCVWRKKKTFSIFTCYAKKKIRKMVWDYIWLCLFRSYRTFDLILERQHFQW